ncbi:MAG: hypothetical protein J6W74_02830 [Bacteroidales bacterium]|nr:hypothetical protein [Bacteroidales bacterium]
MKSHLKILLLFVLLLLHSTISFAQEGSIQCCDCEYQIMSDNHNFGIYKIYWNRGWTENGRVGDLLCLFSHWTRPYVYARTDGIVEVSFGRWRIQNDTLYLDREAMIESPYSDSDPETRVFTEEDLLKRSMYDPEYRFIMHPEGWITSIPDSTIFSDGGTWPIYKRMLLPIDIKVSDQDAVSEFVNKVLWSQ